MAGPTSVSAPRTINCHIQGLIDKGLPRTNAKKIFVFCDGTGNKFMPIRAEKDGNSNVVKLYTTLRVADDQVAYYHPGVGTMGDPTIRHALPRWWSMIKGLAFGSGFKSNVLDAYRYLMEVYNDGDAVYVFGFSRGAYTARALVGMLHGFGLLCRGNEGHVEYVWAMFHDQTKGKREDLKKSAPVGGRAATAHSIQHNCTFAETYSRRVIVRFLGLWDTVSSVGWIYSPVRLLDMAQNASIQVGRHAVSIDERRAYYRDNLWGPPVAFDDPEWPAELREQGICQDIAQVWFPGVHSDVGGSYKQDEAAPANEALEWMIRELEKHGAELCKERVDMVLGKTSGVYKADDIYTPSPSPDHCLHESLDWRWWLLQLFPQQYYDREDGKIQWRVPYGMPRSILDGSFIHGSAVRRMDSTTPGEEPYSPRNLDRNRIKPLTSPARETTADLSDCFVYNCGKAKPPGWTKTALRLAKLAVGWITFALFWLIISIVAWYVIKLLLLVFLGLCRLIVYKSLLKTLWYWIIAAAGWLHRHLFLPR